MSNKKVLKEDADPAEMNEPENTIINAQKYSEFDCKKYLRKYWQIQRAGCGEGTSHSWQSWNSGAAAAAIADLPRTLSINKNTFFDKKVKVFHVNFLVFFI